MEKKVDVILFGVEHGGDLGREYPELKEIEEFKDLSPKELRFCWLVGNRTSPIFTMGREEKMKRALSIVWGDNYKKNVRIKELVSAGADESMIPEHIMTGILRMTNFSPSYRLKAKLMAEYIFETLSKMIVVDPVTMHTMDIDDKKKYADFVIKVSSELQGMIERLEKSYGVKTIDRTTKSEIMVGINDVIG